MNAQLYAEVRQAVREVLHPANHFRVELRERRGLRPIGFDGVKSIEYITLNDRWVRVTPVGFSITGKFALLKLPDGRIRYRRAKALIWRRWVVVI